MNLLGSFWAEHERPDAERIHILPGPMLGPEMIAGLAAAPVQSCAVAVAVLGPNFWETLPSLVLGPLQRKSQPAGLGFVAWVEGSCADFTDCACLLVRDVP